jgi:uncharacterized membrane protein (Fun14 family)
VTRNVVGVAPNVKRDWTFGQHCKFSTNSNVEFLSPTPKRGHECILVVCTIRRFGRGNKRIELPKSAIVTRTIAAKMVENKPDDAIERALEQLKPILSKLSFGMFAGYTSGYATKKIGKVAAVLVGVGFIFLQSLAAAGYIEIDWLKVQDTAVKRMDIVSVNKMLCPERGQGYGSHFLLLSLLHCLTPIIRTGMVN